MAMALGCWVGYDYRNTELVTNTQTLSNVLVLARDGDHDFRMQTDKGQVFRTHLCDGSHADWQAGEKLALLNYEQREGCKSIVGKNLGFIAYTDGQGRRRKFIREE